MHRRDACIANVTGGEAACIGFNACNRNQGDIGKRACRGQLACIERLGPIGENACVGTNACERSGPGAIGRSACIGERACQQPRTNRARNVRRTTEGHPPEGRL